MPLEATANGGPRQIITHRLQRCEQNLAYVLLSTDASTGVQAGAMQDLSHSSAPLASKLEKLTFLGDAVLRLAVSSKA